VPPQPTSDRTTGAMANALVVVFRGTGERREESLGRWSQNAKGRSVIQWASVFLVVCKSRLRAA